MRALILLASAAALAACPASALIVGGFPLDRSAFADSVFSVADPQRFRDASGALIGPDKALAGPELDGFFEPDGIEFAIVSFVDNLAINGPGDDLVIFDVADQPGDCFLLIDTAAFFTIEFAATGLRTSGGRPINVGFFDFSDSGVAKGEAVREVALIGGFGIAPRLSAVAALHNLPVPAPATLALLGSGVAGLVAVNRRSRARTSRQARPLRPRDNHDSHNTHAAWHHDPSIIWHSR